MCISFSGGNYKASKSLLLSPSLPCCCMTLGDIHKEAHSGRLRDLKLSIATAHYKSKLGPLAKDCPKLTARKHCLQFLVT